MTPVQRAALRASFYGGGGYTAGDPYGGHKLDWSWDTERRTFVLTRRDAYSDGVDSEDLDDERFFKMLEYDGWTRLAEQLGAVAVGPEVSAVPMRGDRVEQVWRQLDAELTDVRPVILGPRESVDRLGEQQEGSDPMAILARADAAEVPAAEDGLVPLRWPEDVAPQSGLTIPRDLGSNRTYDRVYLGLVPTADSTEICAWLNWGGWNDCPHADVHVALHRRWREQFGARLIGASEDTLEFVVERGPQTREEAYRLARQQHRYCEDLVDQGIGSVAELAASLLGAKTWYFWWD